MKKMSGTKKTVLGLLLGAALVFGGGSAVVVQDVAGGKDPELPVVTGLTGDPSHFGLVVATGKDPEVPVTPTLVDPRSSTIATATFIDPSSPVVTVATGKDPELPVSSGLL